MEIGDSASVTVDSRKVWNHSDIHLELGQTYRFKASGRWVDWFFEHGPDGNPSALCYMRLVEPLRRMPKANWFCLIGAVDQDISSAFVIGAGIQIQCNRSGRLTCFANDMPHFYWNNRGTVQLIVTRTG